MAEWTKAAVLKTVERKLRGFESLCLRLVYRSGKMREPKLYLVVTTRNCCGGMVYDNFLVVGIHPTEWISVTQRRFGPLVNFWEITEAAFGGFSHEEQTAAWDEFHKLCPEDF
jgi:hypothetical protein